MGGAHAMLKKHLTDSGYKMKQPVVEEYVTDPATEKDPNKVLSRIYYLH
jgi:effector-binding domain-containing protein